MNEEPEEASRIYAVRFREQARQEIDDAVVYLAQVAGEEVADEWQNGLLAALATLARLPRRQVVAPESRFARREIRQMVYRRTPDSIAYRILFTLFDGEEEAPFVRILHIRHGAKRSMTRAEVRTLDTEE